MADGQCTSWLLKSDLEEQKGIWLRVTKELHGQSWSAGASLFLLKMENLGPLPHTINEGGEAVGNGLQSDEEEALCK